MKERIKFDPQIFADNLKKLRIENGYSISDIRDYLCLGSVQSVYKYESGDSMPTAEGLLTLMDLYGIYVSALVASNGKAK